MSLADKIKANLAGAKPKPPLTLRPELLLHANTVPPMHGVVPRVLLGQEWWDETRKAAAELTGNRCAACGISKYEALKHQWLEGHEVYTRNYAKGRQVYIETVALCHYCHSFIHDGRLKSLLDKREITKAQFDDYMRHGNAVLRKAGLTKQPPYVGKIAKWADWRLVLFGVEYPPLYKSYQHWLSAFWDTDEGCPRHITDKAIWE